MKSTATGKTYPTLRFCPVKRTYQKVEEEVKKTLSLKKVEKKVEKPVPGKKPNKVTLNSMKDLKSALRTLSKGG